MEKDYLDLALKSCLSLHSSYSDEKYRNYFFQNIWLADAVKQCGMEKCREEINNNLQSILEKTYENYKKLERLGSSNSREFRKEIETLGRILSEREKNKIIIFGMNERERIEIYFFF